MEKDLETRGLDPKDGLLTTHPEMTLRQMEDLTAKKLQEEDTKNPLPLQRTYYLEKKDRKKSRVEPEDEKEFEAGLHSIDYSVKDMSAVIDMLAQGVRSWIPTTRPEFLAQMIASMDLRTRKEDDAFLRTPVEGERKCISDENCEGTKIQNARPVILMEKLTSKELREKEASGGKKVPASRRLCVMCQRYIVAYFYINCRAECATLRTNVKLSSYFNLVDKVGEYLLEDCVMSSSTEYQGLPAPVVLHTRNKYKQVVQDGVTYYQQIGYPRPEEAVTETVKGSLFS